jgi:pimeloyl-ACP methyl ester carboxylesterase
MCCNVRCWYAGLSVLVVLIAVALKGVHEKSNDKQPLPVVQPKTFGVPLRPDVKVVVMLSGWPDTHNVWGKQVEAMQDEYHIVSIVSPDHDRSALRKPWGYTLEEVPKMIQACIDLHLGAGRKIDLLVTHDWGALYGYYIMQLWKESGERRVERLVAIDIGASENDDASLPSSIPGITQATLFSVPYQLFLGTLFAVGSGLSESVAELITANGWPLMPLLTPMKTNFDWESEAVRPQQEVKWFMGYTYFYLWVGRLGLGPPVPSPLFPTVPTLFVYGGEKRTMFHSEAFVERLKATPGSHAIEYKDSSHWLMYTDSNRFNKDLFEFASIGYVTGN